MLTRHIRHAHDSLIGMSFLTYLDAFGFGISADSNGYTYAGMIKAIISSGTTVTSTMTVLERM